ncbi:acid protease [Suillus decipiens]|nr:acid protease [Suillus decipiens]
MFPAALLTFLLVFSITGSPVKAGNSSISIPLTSRVYFSNGTNNLLEHDRARVKALRDPRMRSRSSVNVPLIDDYRNYGHSLAVGIGNPPTTYNLLLDSGSANTWVRASKYVETGPSFCTGQPVGLTYASGSFFGTEWLDYVTVGPGLTVILQSIGVADETAGHRNYDGVIGIGPVALTVGSLRDLPTEPIQTITDSLFGQGAISENVLGIFFEPYTRPPSEVTGQITFGGTDPTKYNGNIEYAPTVNTGHSGKFWGVKSRITYNNREILRFTAGFVDSGATFIKIATDAYQKYQFLTGAVYDRAVKLLTIPEDKYDTLHNLDFHIGEARQFCQPAITPLAHHFVQQIYSLTPNAQIWPRSLNTMIGGKEDSIYLIVTNRGTYSGQEGCSDFSLGYVFMQRFYVAYDSTNSRVGFATTAFTDAVTN